MTTDLRGFYATYGGEYRYAKEDKDVDVQLLLFERRSARPLGTGLGAP